MQINEQDDVDLDLLDQQRAASGSLNESIEELQKSAKEQAHAQFKKQATRRMSEVDIHNKPKMGYLLLLTCIISMSGVLVGYAMAYQNQLNQTFELKFGWPQGSSQANTWEGIIGASVVVGMTIGASTGGQVMAKGRRKALLAYSSIGIVGCCITQIFNIYAILFGRVLFGLSTGGMVCISSKYLEETIPTEAYEFLSPIVIVGNSLGTLVAFLLGLLLPNKLDVAALESSMVWRVFYAYVPLSMYGLMMIGMFTVAKYDSLQYLIDHDQLDDAKSFLRNIYTNTSDKAINLLIEAKTKDPEDGDQVAEISIKDVFCHPLYKRATWVNIGYMFFHEVAGINVIYQYSNQIYEDMGYANPIVGTITLGAVAVFSSMTSMITVKVFSRRAIFIGGHLGIFVAWIMTAIFAQTGHQTMVSLSLNLFMFFFSNTSGTISWTYAAETCCAQALGFVIMSIYVNVIYLAVVCPILIGLGAVPVFIGLGVFSLIGTGYCWYFIEETKGLDPKQKKQVFAKRSGAIRATHAAQ